MRKDNYFGAQFFVPGKKYIVITHRPDTEHIRHYFDNGEEVTCVDVVRVGESKTVKGANEFPRDFLKGTFINSEGLDQTLCTGDVKRCR